LLKISALFIVIVVSARAGGWRLGAGVEMLKTARRARFYLQPVASSP
jgi:hypothetical protein